jgi:glycosyltransferase involved in cell wall biosynthesis
VPAKIAFVINSIGSGGAERVLQLLLEARPARLAATDIHLILLDNEPERRAMPSFVVKHVLDGRGRMLRSFRLLYRELSRVQPDLIVSFLVRSNVTAVLSGHRLGIPVVVCERMHLSSHLQGRYKGMRRLAARLVPRFAYRFATTVLGVSTGVSEDLVQRFGVDRGRVRTIFNPFDVSAIQEAASKEPELLLPSRFVVAVGRLEPSKDFDLLLRAFAAAALPHHLVILGEGSQLSALERKAADLGIAEKTVFAGYVSNPFPIVARSEFYVSSSRNEGFPNAMVEAMALGKAVVASDCRSGPAEILGAPLRAEEKGVIEAEHGILVEEGSVDALTRALQRMASAKLRIFYEEQARIRVQDFAADAISAAYWSVFEATASEPSGVLPRDGS